MAALPAVEARSIEWAPLQVSATISTKRATLPREKLGGASPSSGFRCNPQIRGVALFWAGNNFPHIKQAAALVCCCCCNHTPRLWRAQASEHAKRRDWVLEGYWHIASDCEAHSTGNVACFSYTTSSAGQSIITLSRLGSVTISTAVEFSCSPSSGYEYSMTGADAALDWQPVSTASVSFMRR